MRIAAAMCWPGGGALHERSAHWCAVNRVHCAPLISVSHARLPADKWHSKWTSSKESSTEIKAHQLYTSAAIAIQPHHMHTHARREKCTICIIWHHCGTEID